MNKLCCCVEPELPDISVSFNCACCDSRVERRTDAPDFDMAVKETSEYLQEDKDQKKKEEEEEEEITYCCCFQRKRHAKSKKAKKKRHDGGKT